MFDLDYQDIYAPNTETMRNYLESLNYSIMFISPRQCRDPAACKSICFSEWIAQFDTVKQSNTLYYSMNKPTLTEEQAKFVISILHICPDYLTFKEALEQYINSNP